MMPTKPLRLKCGHRKWKPLCVYCEMSKYYYLKWRPRQLREKRAAAKAALQAQPQAGQ
jgi:biotin synthase-like enzyme